MINKKTLSERDICAKFITPALERAGWDKDLRFLKHMFLLYKDSSGNAIDILKFSWTLTHNDSAYTFGNLPFDTISFFLPVPQSFGKANFLAFEGQRFLNSVPFSFRDGSSTALSGKGTLYFVSVKEDLSYPPEKYIRLSGLFDGNIGDSVFIKREDLIFKWMRRS